MSKTVTLETAKALKAAFDAAGIEMPETQWYWRRTNGRTHYKIEPKAFHSKGLTQIPAPDAEELGEWFKGLKWWGSKPREIMTPHIEIEERGYYVCLLSAKDSTELWSVSHSHPTIAEGLAALMLKLFEKDPEQIKNHLSK